MAAPKSGPLSVACPACDAEPGERCRTDGRPDHVKSKDGSAYVQGHAGFNYYPKGQEHGTRAVEAEGE